MRRVLLSPNLVFEASRSSLGEPDTRGPQGGTDETPNLRDALGTPVAIRLSSRLMAYLSEHGSVLLAPVVTRRWGFDWWCSGGGNAGNDKNSGCPTTTWLERLILLNQKQNKPDAPTDTTKPDELPTAALAVRSIGISHRKIGVVAIEESPDGQVNFRPRKASDKVMRCNLDDVDVPVVQFSAEIVSIKDGRILARIDEVRMPQVTRDYKATAIDGLVPIMASAYTRTIAGKADPTSRYDYVLRWEKDSLCENAAAALREMAHDVGAKMEDNLEATLDEVYGVSLGALYK